MFRQQGAWSAKGLCLRAPLPVAKASGILRASTQLRMSSSSAGVKKQSPLEAGEGNHTFRHFSTHCCMQTPPAELVAVFLCPETPRALADSKFSFTLSVAILLL